MSNLKLSESDTRANYIDPAIQSKGWNGISLVVREYTYTVGRKLSAGSPLDIKRQRLKAKG